MQTPATTMSQTEQVWNHVAHRRTQGKTERCRSVLQINFPVDQEVAGIVKQIREVLCKRQRHGNGIVLTDGLRDSPGIQCSPY